MPVTPTYPGVYIEEIPSGVRTITGVATAITAFIGQALQGPVNTPVRVQSYADYERQFGGLWIKSPLSYMVQQYFLNGGSDAIVIRVTGKDAAPGTAVLGALTLAAKSPGVWSDGLLASVSAATGSDPALFTVTISRKVPPSPIQQALNQTPDPIDLEIFRNVSVAADSPRFVQKVLDQESALVQVSGSVPTSAPTATTAPIEFTGGNDGALPDYADYLGSLNAQTGLYALEQADLFNLLCIPPRTLDEAVADSAGGRTLLQNALAYCEERRAMLLVDPPTGWKKIADVTNRGAGVDSLGLRSQNAVIYFPRVKLPDPKRDFRLEEFPPSGIMAGIYARTDVQRGVWKAPAGIDAVLSGVSQLSYTMTDKENGILNPIGVNCLRTFPVYGNIAWGARTLKGADEMASEWKYVPVRRLALFLEESLYRGTKWVVFEPNDEPLWSQIRLNIGAFMNNLFRQGAFQGSSPAEAYFVKCDKETTTQNDINLGIVNIVVGYAPLKPAEFVIIKFQQIAGKIAA
ncbi:phage tail sheath family protein [Leptothermofonsia sichuanensis E412]|uniref:phage tail sheath C-terminal domain-containing protein n=1 Tax=Leptothermofonsia sichuanensis TaxID=2917832 RepID=UPI001CA6269E|nr:phage tail sheath C-terminal domain-containing protein [Leptothermofonsia sichuanensis]QZZ19506.1 phage tail sheath family protein [Leptothermofonsia sichuanensis E412]